MRHRWLPPLLWALSAPPLGAQGVVRDSVAPPDTLPAKGLLRPALWDNFVDLDAAITGRGVLGGAWRRFTPCDPTMPHPCNPGLFPVLRPEVQFGARIEGAIAGRMHIDVDYDQRRMLAGANRINVYYQGLAGEVLQRVELGDVSIRLPVSRYLTAGIAGGNFGLKATGQVGRLDLQAIWAEQQGATLSREFRLGGVAGPAALAREARTTLDDADYVHGQFFFLLDPMRLRGAPHVDALALRAEDAPPELRPARSGSIQLYRDERPSLTNPEQRAQLGYVLAEAVAAGGALAHRGRFRRMVPGEEYVVHPSGLWVVLRTPLRRDEALAVAFATESGGVVGTLDAERAPPGAPPTLFLLRPPAPLHQPGRATWDFEMHQVYRIDASADVEPGSVELAVALGDPAAGATFREVGGRALSFLKLFALDEEPPAERLDEARIFQPSRGWGIFGEGPTRFGGTYLIFPTLRPFAEPRAAPSAGLDAGGVRAVLGADLNPAIYDDPDPVRRGGSGRFRLRFGYRIRLEGDPSTFTLGAFGVREGSETLTLGGRPLRRNVDYAIDYVLGTVTLTGAAAMASLGADAELRASWEERSLVPLTPRTLFGMSARYPLGGAGELNVIGLYRGEKPVMARPQLGAEPGSIFLSGVNGALELGASWLDRLIGPLADSLGSRFRLGGELALSLPNPNRRGLTYLDDFEAGDDLPLALDQRLWHLGSRPEERSGAEGALPPDALDVANAAPLVWQSELLDEAERIVGPRLARDIDRQIQLAGTQRTEPVLYLTFGNGKVSRVDRRWRSVTTVLSTTGRDLSRAEYLEFYASASPGQELALVFDLGTISEDAFYFDEAGRTGGEYPDGRRWGLGVLDEEARTGLGEVWSARQDSLGLWNPPCRAEPGQRAYHPGDPRANCTRGNGEVDTEDLDGDGILQERDGAHFRYVVRLDRTSPYLVRGRGATGTEFALYRIPLRGPGALALNGADEATWRYIKHLRLTVTGRAGMVGVPDIALARLRIVGSRWMKRDLAGILSGLTDDRPGLGAASAELRVGPVSRITDGAAYVSPPGVGDEVQDPAARYGRDGVEYNEKSLRIAYRGLEGGERGEVYFRYPQQPRSLLGYRELRLWALPRAGRWGRGDGERLVVSLGSDARNRYLFQTPLRPTGNGDLPRREEWLPEVVIDFERWFELKGEAEAILAARGGGDGRPLTLWSEDSSYAIVLEDRARAPNLAAVREIAFAVYNAGASPADGELWLDDLRLGGAVREPALAGHGDLSLRLGEFADASIAYGRRGAFFRDADREALQQGAAELGVDAIARLGHLLPDAWGLDLPLTVSHTRTALDPTFLERSDVRASDLPGVRGTGAEQTRVTLAVRRAAPVDNPWIGWLAEGVYLRLGYQGTAARALTARDETRLFDAALGYAHRPAAREIALLPAPVAALLRALLPRPIEESALARGVVEARVRWTPEELTVATTFSDQASRSFRYGGILDAPEDTLLRPLRSPRRGLETTARLALRPLPPLTASAAFTSGRDLLSPWPLGGAEVERSSLAGLDLGWERRRTLETRVDFRPALTPWLRPGIGYTTRYFGDRAAFLAGSDVERDDAESLLSRRYQGERQLKRSLVLDPEGAATALHPFRPVELSWSTGLASHFERETLGPGLGYQFGLVGFDAFRAVGRDSAATATIREAFQARGGIRLPLRGELGVGYRSNEGVAHDRGSGYYRREERGWPDLRLSFSELPLPSGARAVLAHGMASVGYQRTERLGRPGGDPAEARTAEEEMVPYQLTLALANGMNGSYFGVRSRGSAADPTGSSESVAMQHALQFTGSIAPPGALKERVEAPLHFALGLSLQTRRQCRVQAQAAEGCIPFVDQANRQLSLTLDTVISQLNVGLEMSYNDRQSFVGLRSGSSQFQLAIFGEFNIDMNRRGGVN
jgi:hypothetical protein